MRYLRTSVWVFVLGVLLGGYFGYRATGDVAGALSSAFIVVVLSLLEVSLSFDNSIVNATVLRDMDEVWRRRFLTWGILVAVFGMRVVLPIVLVAILGQISPLTALSMAMSDPARYAQTLQSAHISVAAFGGAFLAMVGLKYFFDHEKDVHWVAVVEGPLAKLGRAEAVELGLVLLLLYGVSTRLGDAQLEFLIAGIFGLVTFVAVDAVGELLRMPEGATGQVARSGFSSFLYLEVLDASFSFDGVIGAFALSSQLFVIAIGLGVGAMFVRSLTVLFVETGTLTRYRYLEHGAFYAIIVLGVIMFIQSFAHIPEAVAGLAGAVIIITSFMASVHHNRKTGETHAPVPVIASTRDDHHPD